MLACGWNVGDDNRALVEAAIGHALDSHRTTKCVIIRPERRAGRWLKRH
jgi:hypothetical protein